MKKKIFISHSVEDKQIVDLLSDTLRVLSLNQVKVWYSTSCVNEETLAPGDIWFTRICNEIKSCKVIIVLLTPNSINKPWIYFESGIAEGCIGKLIIPLCVGISRDDIKLPLSSYQIYQLSDYDSACSFISSVFNTIGIHFCEEISKDKLQLLVKETSLKLEVNETYNEYMVEDILDELKYHIDKRMIELSGMLSNNKIKNLESTPYIIKLDNLIDGEVKKQYIEIKYSDSVQNVLNRIYFLLDNHVKPYTYMHSWILENKDTGAKMVMYEITEFVMAVQVFKPNTTWRIIKLKEPYTSSNSHFYRGDGLKKYKNYV